MRNVNVKVKDNVATITVNLDATTSESKSGKTDLLATTAGNVTIHTLPDGRQIKLGLNSYITRK